MSDYDTDFYTWTQAQVAAICAGAWDDLDRAHLAEEIEDVGKSEQVDHDRWLLVRWEGGTLDYAEPYDVKSLRR